MFNKSIMRIIILSMSLMLTAYATTQTLIDFENSAVKQAYYNENKDLTKGIFLEFEPNKLPTEQEKQMIFKIAKQAGLKELEVTQFKYVTIWAFDWPHWRFNEEGLTVCEQFKERSYSLWQKCKSNTRIVVWTD